MKDNYRDAMDALRFTPTQKEQMVENLLSAPAARPARPRRLRRFAAAGVAAALALSLGVAGATGALDSASNAFAGLFGGAHTEIIDQIGYPIGASDTCNGVTITADAIIGDTYSYAIVYSIRRDDGAPLVSQELLAAGEEYDGRLLLAFESQMTDLHRLFSFFGGGRGGYSCFFDADPADNAVQFVEFWTEDTPVRPCSATATFQNLYDTTNGYENKELLVEGTWNLEFRVEFADSSIALSSGQDFTLNGMDATLDAVTLSPLSIMVEYTVYEKVPETVRENGLEDAASDPYAPFRDLPIVITYTDGTTLEIGSGNTSISSGVDSTKCLKGLMFETLRPLDEVVSVTVGDIVLPVSAGG